mmetsp:Transcript_15154/g.40883  ORF Transcript_15154/g.40883 Transcript_15154/m.40883 type:complete len:265 (+) Transcript_15154:1365-2159(+)
MERTSATTMLRRAASLSAPCIFAAIIRCAGILFCRMKSCSMFRSLALACLCSLCFVSVDVSIDTMVLKKTIPQSKQKIVKPRSREFTACICREPGVICVIDQCRLDRYWYKMPAVSYVSSSLPPGTTCVCSQLLPVSLASEEDDKDEEPMANQMQAMEWLMKTMIHRRPGASMNSRKLQPPARAMSFSAKLLILNIRATVPMRSRRISLAMRAALSDSGLEALSLRENHSPKALQMSTLRSSMNQLLKYCLAMRTGSMTRIPPQ